MMNLVCCEVAGGHEKIGHSVESFFVKLEQFRCCFFDDEVSISSISATSVLSRFTCLARFRISTFVVRRSDQNLYGAACLLPRTPALF